MEYIITDIQSGEVVSAGAKVFESEQELSEFSYNQYLKGRKVHWSGEPDKRPEAVGGGK
jgi:hypothetical protein